MSAKSNGHDTAPQLFDTGRDAENAAREARAEALRQRTQVHLAGMTGAVTAMRARGYTPTQPGEYDAQIDHLDSGGGPSLEEARRMAEPITIKDLPNEGAKRAAQIRDQKRAAGKRIGRALSIKERNAADRLPTPPYGDRQDINATNASTEPPDIRPETSVTLSAQQSKHQSSREVTGESAEAFAIAEGTPSNPGDIPLLKTPMSTSLLPDVSLADRHRR